MMMTLLQNLKKRIKKLVCGPVFARMILRNADDVYYFTLSTYSADRAHLVLQP